MEGEGEAAGRGGGRLRRAHHYINNAFGEGNWYLDHLDTSWRDVYDNKPCSDLSPAMCRKVLGGHGQTWGETVDGSDLI